MDIQQVRNVHKAVLTYKCLSRANIHKKSKGTLALPRGFRGLFTSNSGHHNKHPKFDKTPAQAERALNHFINSHQQTKVPIPINCTGVAFANFATRDLFCARSRNRNK